MSNTPEPAAKTERGAAAASSPGQTAAALRYLRSVLGPLLALVVVMVFFAVVDLVWSQGKFSTTRNARTVAVQTCVVAVAALGMTVIIISGGIDLSAGAALALCATTLAWGLREDVAVLISYGGNFASLSRSLEKSQAELQTAAKGGDEDARAYWSAKAARQRLRLLQLAERKLPQIESLARSAAQQRERFSIQAQRDLARTEHLATSDSEADREHFEDEQKRYEEQRKRYEDEQRRYENDVKRMQQRIENLGNESFAVKVGPSWLEGIPNAPLTPLLAALLGIGTGLLAGLVNGMLISTLRVVPFIVTLGTMTIFIGLGNLLSGDVPIRPSLADQIPSWISDITKNSDDALWLGFPPGVWLALALAIALGLVLKYTVFGRYVFALGSSEATARLCGINVPATKIAIYVLSGLFIGVAGIYQFSRLSTGNPMAGVGLELKVIAAVVIGGASLSGGRGTVLGTLAGATMMATIDSGCAQLELPDSVQRIILGVIIISAVVVDQIRQRRSA